MYRRSLQIIILLLSQLLPGMAEARQDFFDQRYRGWLWFEEREILEQQEQQEKQMKNAPPTKEDMLAAKKDNEAFAEELELLRHLAIKNPDNLQYIELYKRKEKVMMDNAVKLGKNWHVANFLNPDIMDELQSPQNIYGRRIYQDQKDVQREKELKSLANKVELFVFRQEDCPYCEDLEKHLNRFAKLYGFKVEAVSADTSKSKYFTTNSSKEIITALGLEIMPTVIAVSGESRERYELARGAVSVADLEDKSMILANYLQMQQKKQVKQ